MSIQRTNQLLETIDQGRVVAFIDNTTSYPYTHTEKLKGLCINNRDSNTLTITVTTITGAILTFTLAANEVFDEVFDYFKIINASGSTDFIMCLKAEK